MDQKSKTLFVKLMSMTTSSHDGEALVAIRKANAILAEANVNWEEFLAALDQHSQQVVASRSHMTPPSKRKGAQSPPWSDYADAGKLYTDDIEIDRLFERVYDRVSSGNSFYEFIQSVHDYWIQKGYLTEAQYQAIKRAAR